MKRGVWARDEVERNEWRIRIVGSIGSVRVGSKLRNVTAKCH